MKLKAMFLTLKVFFMIFMMSLHFSNLVLKIKESSKSGMMYNFAFLILWTTSLILMFVVEKGEE